MAGMEIVYTANEVYGWLGVSDSTLKNTRMFLKKKGMR